METPEALDGMGEAHWWLGDAQSSIRYRERAYLKYRQAGEMVNAGMTAVNLSITFLFNLGNESAARGWLARAERLMHRTAPNPIEGWLWDLRSFLTPDSRLAKEFLSKALECARSSGDLDIELVALADLGLSLVMEGDTEAGMELLDEAMAGTLGGEYRRLSTVVFTCCSMLSACDLLGDLQRASQWCRLADDFMNQFSSPFLFAHCRTHYGNVLVAKGQWELAESELQAALRMCHDAGAGRKAEVVARLADLRFRQGRLEEAEALLTIIEVEGVAVLPAATVRLAQGEPGVAIALLDRRLRQLGERSIEAAPVLAVLVEAHLAQNEIEAAASAAARLHSLAQTWDRPQAAGLAMLASGRVAAAEGRLDDAVGDLERALEEFSRLELPLETAWVRLELARALTAKHPEFAAAEARSALTTFEQLGASARANEAASLLRSLGAPTRAGARNLGALTKREQEVLRLVGLGLSNPEIGQRLFISRKTAAHHVSNLLSKLGLRNRAEAVAYLARTVN